VRPAPAQIPFHALRSAVVAATILTLAATAHVVAGGELPPPGILLAFLAFTGLVSTTATRLRLRLPAMTALLGTGQVVLHEAFTAFSVTGAPDGNGGAAAQPHHAALLPPPASAHQLHLRLHELDSGLAVGMLAGHTLATLACALLLAKGEDALWTLAAWLRPLAQPPAPAPPSPAARPALSVPARPAAPLPWRNLRRDCRRGPPAAVVYP
jgi:hypothetical protein